jgi:hypothetical protein
MVKKKEAVADSVEATRQNELPKETRAITCPKCDPKQALEGLKRANRNLYIESNERKLVIDRIVKCLADYQHHGMSSESFINTVATILEPHTRFVDYLAVKDLEEKEGERVGSIYSASEVLPSLDLEEKEAVTRNTAVLQALESIRDFVAALPAKIDDAEQNECLCGSIQAEHGCPQCAAMSALYREIEKAEQDASVVLDGQPESATGASSKTLPALPCEHCGKLVRTTAEHPICGLCALRQTQNAHTPSPLPDNGEQKENP